MNREEKVKELPRQVDRLADLLELVEFEREAIRKAQEHWKNNADFIEFMEKIENWCKDIENAVEEIADQCMESCSSLDDLTR